jgi:hypothetical protein
VSFYKAPDWWKGWVFVGPKIHFVLIILLDLILIPITEWIIMFKSRKELNATGFAHFYHLCGFLQLAFVGFVLF